MRDWTPGAVDDALRSGADCRGGIAGDMRHQLRIGNTANGELHRSFPGRRYQGRTPYRHIK